jgi:hypothetical protein
MVIRINVHSAGENPTYTTRTLPMKLHIHPAYASCGQSLYMATFHESSVDLDGSHCSREKGLPTQSTARQLIDPRVRTQFLSQANQWSSRLKPSLYRWQDTRLSGLISPACDRYVQYLLTGANPLVLNQRRRGLQPWRCRLSTYDCPTFPTSCLPFPPRRPIRSQVIKPLLTIWLKGDHALNLVSGSLHSTSTITYNLSIAGANDVPPR